MNSAILAKDKANLTISNSTITTKKDNSGGIMTAGVDITKATNFAINTYGVSSAAIRTYRRGGTVKVNKGTYQTYGEGSSSIYSTVNITVSDAKLISNA